jgi:ATP phosphoribosyltransferase regulatory subunit HisZ
VADARIRPGVSARVEEALQRQRETNRKRLSRAHGWWLQLRRFQRELEEASGPEREFEKLENLVRYAGDEAAEVCNRLRDSIEVPQ